MTRFARAQGSKSSNQRMPEEATKWQDLKPKKQFKRPVESNGSELETTHENVPKRWKLEVTESKDVQWADFSDINYLRLTKSMIQNKKISTNSEIQRANTSKIINNPEKNLKHNNTKDKGGREEHRQFVNSKKNLKKSIEQEPNMEHIQSMSNNKKKKNEKCVQQKVDLEHAEQSLSSDKKKKIKKKKVEQHVDMEHGQQSVNIDNKKNKKHENSTEESQNQSSQPQNTERDCDSVSSKNKDQFSKNELKTNDNQHKSKQLKKSKKHEHFNTDVKKQFTNQNSHFPNKKNNFEKNERTRRKPVPTCETIFVGGKRIEIAYFSGFPVKKEDADRLKVLKQEMISRGIPHSEVTHTLKLERRKAEKALTREKKKLCFHCRQSGHNLSECPSLSNENAGTGICYKCGSTEHTHFECKVVRNQDFKFAQCFICKEQGHISRQCPDNPRGLYPKGGACRMCGDVTHLKKDCPQLHLNEENGTSVAAVLNNNEIETLDEEVGVKSKNTSRSVQNKIIKF